MPPRKPGAALCVMPPKKRSKLDTDGKEENGFDLRESTMKVSDTKIYSCILALPKLMML